MNLNNLINYSDDFADTTALLYHFKRPNQTRDNNGAVDSIADTSTSFKYQWELIKKQVTPVDVGKNIDPTVANAHRAWRGVKIVVPLKFVSKFFSSLELPLINTKLYVELNWTKNSAISNV